MTGTLPKATTADVGIKHEQAKLAAAASEMLAALKYLRIALLADHGANGGLTEVSRRRAINIVYEAIAKAEDRQ